MKYGYVPQQVLDEYYVYNEEDKLYYYTWNGYSGSYDPQPNANWAFDENTMTLSMFTNDGYYAYTFTITMSDDHKSFTGVDTKGKTYTFVKAE